MSSGVRDNRTCRRGQRLRGILRRQYNLYIRIIRVWTKNSTPPRKGMSMSLCTQNNLACLML